MPSRGRARGGESAMVRALTAFGLARMFTSTRRPMVRQFARRLFNIIKIRQEECCLEHVVLGGRIR